MREWVAFRIVGGVAEGVQAQNERELRGFSGRITSGVWGCCSHGVSFLEGRQLRDFGVQGQLELGSMQRDAEDGASGFEEAAGAEAV